MKISKSMAKTLDKVYGVVDSRVKELRTKHLAVWVTPKQFDQISELAARRGISNSALLREMVEFLIKEFNLDQK